MAISQVYNTVREPPLSDHPKCENLVTSKKSRKAELTVGNIIYIFFPIFRKVQPSFFRVVLTANFSRDRVKSKTRGT